MRSATLDIWTRFAELPFGKWTFSRFLCLKAPYFGSIRPVFAELRPGFCEIHIRKRRAVLNHIGTVHAIAMCNMVELAAGTMTDVTIPPTHRWIPKAMTVQYLKKAESDLRAVAKPAAESDLSAAGEYVVNVSVLDSSDVAVLAAEVTMWITQRSAPAAERTDAA